MHQRKTQVTIRSNRHLLWRWRALGIPKFESSTLYDTFDSSKQGQKHANVLSPIRSPDVFWSVMFDSGLALLATDYHRHAPVLS